MALFVLAFALAPAGRAARARPTSRAAGRPGAWWSRRPAARARRACSPSALPGSPGSRSRCRSGSSLEALAGRSPVDWARGPRPASPRNRVTLAVAAVILVASPRSPSSPAREFASKIGDVQDSAGRLSSPVFPGEALGIWPAGDFRIVRGEVSGRAARGRASARSRPRYGAFVLVRRRQLALLAMLVAGAVVYVGARLFAEIHVEAKALRDRAARPAGRAARPARRRRQRRSGTRLGVVRPRVRRAASTLLALRDAPIGFDDRQLGLERLAEEAEGETVAFLGVDRFAGYYLRGTLARAPAGYVPEEIAARPEKTWQQGLAADFDTLDSGQLDKFRYAITTTAAYDSTPPPNFEPVARERRLRALAAPGRDAARRRCCPSEGGEPGRPRCDLRDGGPPKRSGEAACSPSRVVADYTEWKTPAPPEARVAGPGARLAGAGHGDDRARPARRRALRALAAVPLAGAAERVLRRRGGSPSCRPRSTACT